jgi:hypothetical protein
MKTILRCVTLALAVAVTTLPAGAKGYIKSAIVGGIAGITPATKACWERQRAGAEALAGPIALSIV